MVRGRNSAKKEYFRDSRDVRALGELLREAVDVDRAERDEASASNPSHGDPSDRHVQSDSADQAQREGQSSAPSKKRREIPGFRLKNPSPHKPATLLQLEEMFGDTLSGEVIEQVHSQIPDMGACVEALISLASDTTTKPPRPTQDAKPEQQGGSRMPQPSLWDSLPPDCQLLIVDSLTTKQLAAAAPTCRSFARLAALRIENVKVIRLRRGCSFESLPGMMCSHIRATQLTLNGISADLRHIVHFESLSAALRRGVDNTRRAQVPLTHLQLQGCAALDMDALQLLLEAVPTIQSLDVSRCVSIDDTAVRTLAQYEPGPADDDVHTVLESMQLEASGYAHTAGTQPLRGAPASGGGSVFLRRNGRDITFGSSIRISPAVAALLRQHAAARAHPDDAELGWGEPASTSHERCPLQQVLRPEVSAPVDTDAAAGEMEGGLPPDPLPAGLTALMLKDCGATGAGVRSLFSSKARCANTLRVLDISECAGVKLSFLANLSAGCALEVLRADACNSLVSVDATLPPSSALRELSLKRCVNLQSVELEAAALEQFSASSSTSLSHIVLTAPRLRQLQATHCRNLQELSIQPPPDTLMLEEVNLEGCGLLPGGSIAALIALSPRLRHCNLGSCRQLAQLMIPENIALEELNVSATAVRTVACHTTTLRTLALRRCLVLESVVLAAPPELCDLHNCVKLQKVYVPADGVESSQWHSRAVEVGGCDSLSDGARRGIRTWATVLRTT